MDETTYPYIPLDLLYYLIWQMQQQKAKQAAAIRAGIPINASPSGSGTDSTGPGPDVAGPMTSAERQSISNLAGGPLGWGAEVGAWDAPTGVLGAAAKSAGNLGMSLGFNAIGMANPTSITSAELQGILGIDSVLDTPTRQAFGLQTDRSLMGPSAADMQAAADKMGYGMPGSPAGLTGGVSVGPSGYGTTGPSSTPGPSVGNPDQAGMFNGTDPGATENDGTSTGTGRGSGGDGSTGGNTGGSEGGGVGNAGDGGGSNRRKGGVFRASRPKTERITWGERGTAPGGRSGETAIFIPDRFQLPGLQENERVVRAALRRSLADILAGRRRSQG
jgi:hypothetical protein